MKRVGCCGTVVERSGLFLDRGPSGGCEGVALLERGVTPIGKKTNGWNARMSFSGGKQQSRIQNTTTITKKPWCGALAW